ncbi:MAG: flagellar hook-associated protein FlgK [Gammaproteobacteria bacterium]
MPDIFNIGVSALLATQRALSTVGHNISNANTAGYSRQRVEMSARDPQATGAVYYGKGVEVTDVSRSADAFLTKQVQLSATSYEQTNTYLELASQLNNMLADAKAGTSSAMTDFFDGIQQLSTQPASVPSRQALLGTANTLISRFKDQVSRMDDINTAINTKIADQVNRVNDLADSIAEINRTISLASGRTGFDSANDLIDRRDQMVLELSKITGVKTFLQDDGAMNVMIGDGISLVTGSTRAKLTTVTNPLDASRTEIGYVVGGASSNITAQMNSGEMGGTLNFRDELLDPTRNALGRLAATLGMTFNKQHRDGMDMTGALGGDFFTVPSPTITAASGNTGTVSLAFDSANVGNLTTSDYTLTYNGTNWQLYRDSDQTTQTLTGAGPFSVDGLTITVGTAPAAGDSYRLQPTRYVARDIKLAINNVSQIAAATPVQSSASLANLGTASISSPTILNVGNAALLTTANIVFDNPPTTYKVNGGASVAYTSGANISVNGWQVQISGSPKAGDTFTVQSNSGGVGDNGNLLQLAKLQSKGILDSGTSTYGDAYGSLVGNVGAVTRQNEASATALKTLLDNAVSSQQAVSGVNLDEEAADLLKFQQAYQAAAQVISIGNSVFDELLNAVRR